MSIRGDASAYWILANEIEGRLANHTLFASLVRPFSLLLDQKPSDLFEVELFPAVRAGHDHAMVTVRPGHRLQVIATAVRTLDFHGAHDAITSGVSGASASVESASQIVSCERS